MAEKISLKAYIAKLDDLLNSSATDEVIHHCRHILQYFPRNIAAYRYLGTALLLNNRWDGAGAIMRRILSVLPDDFDAHIGLSEVNDQRGKPNDAIWHLERAFEQDPTNRQLVERLRELYRRHHQVDTARFQLTTAAVARQYVRNGLIERAIETMRATLERMPQRHDLRLLLAETLWDDQRRVEAAEVALDVLEALPDCLHANRILTEFWLAEDRPSDAARYLNRVEALDPYLALELARGETAPDNAFVLDELDYQRFAQQELATARPDWLNALGDGDAGDFGASATDPFAAAPSAPAASTPARTSGDALPAWLAGGAGAAAASAAAADDDWLSSADFGSVSGTPQPAAGGTSDLPSLDDLFGEPPPRLSQTGELDLGAFSFDETDSPVPGSTPVSAPDPVSDWLSAPDAAPAPPAPRQADDDLFSSFDFEQDSLFDAPTVPPPAPPAAQFATTAPDPTDEDDPFAWAREAGIELDHDAEAPLTQGTGRMPGVGMLNPTAAMDDDDALPDWMRTPDSPRADVPAAAAADDDDPFAWSNTPASADQPDDNPTGLPSNIGDPNAWLRDAGIELDPDAPSRRQAVDYLQIDLESDRPLIDTPDDPNAWLRQAGIAFDEDDAPSDAAPTSGGVVADDEAALTWLEADPLETPDAAPPTAETTVTTNDLFNWVNNDAPPAGDDMTWLERDPLAERPGDDVELIDTAPLQEKPKPSTLTGLLRRAATLGGEDAQNQDAAILSGQTGTQEQGEIMPIDQGDQWKQEPTSDDADDGGFDWMSSFADTPDSAADQPGASAPAAGDTPDWLRDLGEDYTRPETIPTYPTAESNPPPETPLAASTPADAPAAGDTPDWMRDLDATARSAASAPDTTAGELSELEWMTDPDTTDADAAPAAGFEWMTSLDDETPDAPAAPAADDELPDWMRELAPSASGTPAPGAASPAPPPAASDEDLPDWMRAAAPAAPADEPTAADDGAELEWMSFEASAPAGAPVLGSSYDALAPAAAAADDDTPDWMRGFPDDAPAAPTAAADEDDDWMSALGAPAPSSSAPAADSGLEWMSFGDDDQPAAAVPAPTVSAAEDDDTPDWMRGFGTGDGVQDAFVEPAAASTDEPDWLASLGSTTPAASVASAAADDEDDDTPDWMRGFGADDPDSDVLTTPAASVASAAADDEDDDTPDWMRGFGADDPDDDDDNALTTPAASAASTPDWLSGGSMFDDDDDMTAMTQSAGSNDMPGWLSELSADDAPAAETSQPTSGTGSTPNWLSELGAPTDEPAAQTDWLRDDETDEDDEADAYVPAAADDDWVGSLIGTTPAQPEPEPVAPATSEFGWLGDITDDKSDAEPDWLEAEQDAGLAEVPVVDSVEFTPAPADNAPDWLNAMVPGLDLDYAPGEDEPEAESAGPLPFPPMPDSLPSEAPRRSYQWLVDIVDEETGSQPLAAAPAVPAATAPRLPRFTFSRPPAWLRSLTGASRTPPTTSSEFGFDDDDEVPDWLK